MALAACVAVSSAGDTVQLVALTWWALTATGSPVSVGAVSVTTVVVLVVGAPLAGALLDRVDIPRALLLADLWRAATPAGFLAVGAVVSDLHLLHFVALAALTTLGASVFQPGALTLVPFLVGEADAARATAAVSTARSIGRLCGPATAGAVLAVWGPAATVALGGVCFLVSALLVAFGVRRAATAPTRPGPGSGGGSGGRATWRVLRDRPAVTASLVVALVGNLTVSVYVVALPLHALAASSSPESGALRYGVAQAGFQAGMVVTGLLAASGYGRRLAPRSRPVCAALLVMAAAYAAVGALPVGLLVVATCTLGAALMLLSVMSDGHLLVGVPAGSRGRVQGLVQGIGGGLRPVGIVAGTALSAAFSAAVALYVAAAMSCALAAVVLATRAYERGPDVRGPAAGRTSRRDGVPG